MTFILRLPVWFRRFCLREVKKRATEAFDTFTAGYVISVVIMGMSMVVESETTGLLSVKCTLGGGLAFLVLVSFAHLTGAVLQKHLRPLHERLIDGPNVRVTGLEKHVETVLGKLSVDPLTAALAASMLADDVQEHHNRLWWERVNGPRDEALTKQ